MRATGKWFGKGGRSGRTALVRAAVGLGLAMAVGLSGITASSAAAPSVKTSLTLMAPASGPYNTFIQITGRLTRAGTASGLQNATVFLQRSPRGLGKYSNLTSTLTRSAGAFAFSVKMTGAYDYRAYYGGTKTFKAAVSPNRYPVTTRQVLLDAVKDTDWETGAFRASARVVPAPPNGTTVSLQRFDPRSRLWLPQGSAKTVNGRVTVNTNAPGSVTSYRLAIGAVGQFGAGISTSRSFAHFVWRGAFIKPIKVFGVNGDAFVGFPGEPAHPRRGRFELQRTATIQPTVMQIVPDRSGCTRVRSKFTNQSNANFDISFLGSAEAHVQLGAAPAVLTVSRTFTDSRDFTLLIANRQEANLDMRGDIDLLCSN
ncbi:hypothetical protein [Kribbella sp. NPDC055071]